VTLTVGSLFSGIGGLDLGLERAGMHVIWQSEIDPYASSVLAKHWPDVPNLGDITKVDWDGIEAPDLVCGGFPCQPVSEAGRRLAQDDERWLWPELARCVRHLRPRYVLVENVPGLLVRGMGDVLGDLADLGYDAEWESIPAAAVGAPHLRWRVFIVAYPFGELAAAGDVAHAGSAGLEGPGRLRPPGPPGGAEPADGGEGPDVADTGGSLGIEAWDAVTGACCSEDVTGGRQQTEPRGRRVFDAGPGGNGWWESEPDLGRVAHGVPHGVDRLRCLGNAVVPQVAHLVGDWILAAEHLGHGLRRDPQGPGHVGAGHARS
jgi:DNA (cytosine-5)-methyltransferase 1